MKTETLKQSHSSSHQVIKEERPAKQPAPIIYKENFADDSFSHEGNKSSNDPNTWDYYWFASYE